MPSVNSKPEVKSNYILKYKGDVIVGFKYSKEDITLKELKDKTNDQLLKSPTFEKELFDYLYNKTVWFNTLRNEDKYMTVEVINDSLKNFHYSPYNDFYYGTFEFYLTFSLAEWFADNIIKAETSKSFFFKNYKIKFGWDINYLVRYKTDNWKQICIDAIRYGIYNIGRLRNHIEKISRIDIEKGKVDFEIDLNASSKEIKLVIVKGITRWLAKFGIPAKWAKWILLGFTIWGILELLKDEEDKTTYKSIKERFNNFLEKE
jgi:hypothetical protein